MPLSASTSSGIGVGAPVSGSEPLETFGNATICRMSGSPASCATKRSIPIANPPSAVGGIYVTGDFITLMVMRRFGLGEEPV